jgi:hypothetical protein
MSTLTVLAVYLAAVALAVALLYLLRHLSWHWHVLSLVAALAVGLMPPAPGYQGPGYDLTIGFLFIVLFLWGLGMPLFHHPRHRHHHS